MCPPKHALYPKPLRSGRARLGDGGDLLGISGVVYDGAGDPVPDAMVEIWQANHVGRYDPKEDRKNLPIDPEAFSGFGRSDTREGGTFSFVTLKPGPVPGPEGRTQAPQVSVFARGLLKRIVTRIYFPDEGEANAPDPVLSSIEDPELRETLIACDEGDGVQRFDVRLQGKNQTAFFGFAG